MCFTWSNEMKLKYIKFITKRDILNTTFPDANILGINYSMHVPST